MIAGWPAEYPTGAAMMTAQSAGELEHLDPAKKVVVPRMEWLDLVSLDGVPIFWDQLRNGGISLCGRLLNGRSANEADISLELREMKRPALNDADLMLIAASVRLLGAAHHFRVVDLMGNRIVRRVGSESTGSESTRPPATGLSWGGMGGIQPHASIVLTSVGL